MTTGSLPDFRLWVVVRPPGAAANTGYWASIQSNVQHLNQTVFLNLTFGRAAGGVRGELEDCDDVFDTILAGMFFLVDGSVARFGTSEAALAGGEDQRMGCFQTG